MPDIQILSPHLADLIAAGEVVERPASVVKELVENAFDAGARTVTVELRGGGATYLRVTDDGCGMTPEDAGIAFLRHATSKLHDAQGLEAIGTMGFRGEALAAISAVSHITLTTRRQGAPGGTHMTLDAGRDPGYVRDRLPRGHDDDRARPCFTTRPPGASFSRPTARKAPPAPPPHCGARSAGRMCPCAASATGRSCSSPPATTSSTAACTVCSGVSWQRRFCPVRARSTACACTASSPRPLPGAAAARSSISSATAAGSDPPRCRPRSSRPTATRCSWVVFPRACCMWSSAARPWT